MLLLAAPGLTTRSKKLLGAFSRYSEAYFQGPGPRELGTPGDLRAMILCSDNSQAIRENLHHPSRSVSYCGILEEPHATFQLFKSMFS